MNENANIRNNTDTQPYMTKKLKPKCTYTTKDRYYAIAAIIIGFIALKPVTLDNITGLGLMTTVFGLLYTLFNFFYCRSFSMKGSRTTNVIFILSLVLSLSFFICDNSSVTALSLLLILTGNIYYSYASYREGSRSVANNFLRALILPLNEYEALFGALFNKAENSSENKKDRLKKSLPAVIGFAASLPLCAAVIILLSYADSSFSSLFSLSADDLLNFIAEHIIANIFILLFSLPVSAYFFAGVYSRAYKMKHEKLLGKSQRINMRILPPSMCAAFLTPLSVIYVLFTAIQAIHAFSAGVLNSPDFTYSQYAREGFFQLCAVVVINLTVISAITFFSRYENKQMPRLLKIFTVLFCTLTLCLIITALSKMLLYISIYGMTPKRIQTSVFMVYLFVIFVLMILKQFGSKISITKAGYCLAALTLAVMSFVPTDALIAKYNIRQFEQGNIPWMGISAMEELDASAYTVLDTVTEDIGFDEYCEVQEFFESRRDLGSSYKEMTVWDFNIMRFKACGIIEANTGEYTDEKAETNEYSKPTYSPDHGNTPDTALYEEYTVNDGETFTAICYNGRKYLPYGIATDSTREKLGICFAVSSEDPNERYYTLTDTSAYIAIKSDKGFVFFYRAADTLGKPIYKPDYIAVNYGFWDNDEQSIQ